MPLATAIIPDAITPPTPPPLPSTPQTTLFTQIVATMLARGREKEAARLSHHANHALSFMASQISSDENKVHPSSQIDRLSRSDITTLIQAHATTNELYLFLKAVLESSSTLERAGLDRILWIFDAVLLLLEEGRELCRREDIVGGLLLPRVNLLPDREVAPLAERAFDCAMRVGCTKHGTRAAVEGAFELVAKLVHRLKGCAQGGVDPDSRCRADLTQMDGSAFRGHIVRRICEARWLEQAIVPIVVSLKDMCFQLSPDDCAYCCSKVRNEAARVPSADLPDFCFEALLLAAKLNLRGDMCAELLASVEARPVDPRLYGQLLSRFCLAVSQDNQIGALLIAQALSLPTLSTTRLAFLLSVGRVKRFETRVIDVCKRWVLDNAKLGFKVRASAFLSHTLAATLTTLDSIQDTLLSLAEKARQGDWDLLVPILLELGTRLTEVAVPAANHEHPALDLSCSKPTSAEAAVAAIGCALVAKCFELFSLERAEILSQIANRALVARGHPVPFCRVLALIAPLPCMHELGGGIKDMLALLPSMTPRTAHAVLRAISPLLHARRDIRDHLLIVLRKAMFQRDVESRAVALFGLVCAHRAGEDIAGPLGRSLSHQASVREAAYAALGALASPVLNDQVLPCLREKYFEREPDPGYPPYEFDECIDAATGKLVEPLAGLIKLSPLDMYRVDKLITKNFAVFGLDVASSTFDPATTHGLANLALSHVGRAACETLMDKLMAERAMSAETIQLVAGLFKTYRALHLLAERGPQAPSEEHGEGDGKAKGKKAKSASKPPPPPPPSAKKKKATTAEAPTATLSSAPRFPCSGYFLSDQTLLSFLDCLLGVPLVPSAAPTPEQSALEQALGKKNGLFEYLLVAIKERLSNAHRLFAGGRAPQQPPAPRQGQELAEMAELCAGREPASLDLERLGPLLYGCLKRFTRLDIMSETDKELKQQHLVFCKLQELSLECLLDCFVIAKLAQNLPRVAKATFDVDSQGALHVAACEMEPIADSYVVKKHAACALVSLRILNELVLALPPSAPELADHVGWALALCEKYSELGDKICKQVTQTYLEWDLHRRFGEAGIARGGFGEAALKLVEAAKTADSSLIIVAEVSAKTVCKTVLDRVSDALDECLCVVDVCRALRGQDETEAEGREAALFGRLASLAEVLAAVLKKEDEDSPRVQKRGSPELAWRPVVNLYKAATRTLKEFTQAKRVAALEQFRLMVTWLGQHLPSVVQMRLQEVLSSSNKDAKKEAKIFPEVVYNLELFEVSFAKLIKTVASVAGMATLVKTGIARDFSLHTERIALKQPKKKRTKSSSGDEEEEEEEEQGDQVKKKRKVEKGGSKKQVGEAVAMNGDSSSEDDGDESNGDGEVRDDNVMEEEDTAD